MHKKSMMLMEVVVVLVVVLLAAVAIMFLFGKQMGLLSKNECLSKQGQCAKTCDTLTTNYGGCKADEVCCVNVGG